MYLSRLDLHGFKSFAQKTSVAFSPGVTAIVGPNGCGKSNIIDAVRWVLGEQRARLLRSEAMAGVLFNGAAGARALGMAEVSLTVENTRGVLPTEYAEVTITRRLYRSGDSEYLLNGTACRLRDILDLFMDTGMGAGAYSVIELKMVEDILSENADDRRRLFEEAAGVTKYKRRREQALRRLAATEADLTRLDDIIEEVDKQVRTLQRQAQKAVRHQRLATRLRRIELALAAHDDAALQAEHDAKTSDAAARRDAAEALGARIARAEADLEEARAALVGVEQAMAERQAALNAHTQAVRALEAELRVGAEREAADRRALDRVERDRAADAQRAGALDREEEAARAARAAAEQALDAAAARLAEAQERRAAADAEAQTRRAALATARSRAAEALQAARDALAARDRAADRAALQAQQADRLAADRAALDARRAALGDPRALAAEVDRAEQALDAAAADLAVRADARDAARAEAEEAESARQAARAVREAARAEADLLRSLLAGGDGADGAAAFVTAEAHAVAVAELVGCDDADKLALDAALGPWAQTLVVETEADAAAAIARLAGAGKGRATFFALDRLAARGPATPPPTPPGTTPALDLARAADARYAPLLAALLGTVFVADSLDAALRLRDAHPAARFVTREGGWADGSGALHGGSATASAGAARLGFRERLDRAERALGAAESTLADADARAAAARDAHAQAEQVRAEAERARDAARDAREVQRAALARLQTETDALTRQADQLAARAAEIAAPAAQQPEAAVLDEAVRAAQGEADGHEAARRDAERASEQAEAARRAAESDWGEARIAHAQASSAREARTADLARLARTRAELARRQTDLGAEAERLDATLAAAAEAELDLRERLDAARHQTDALAGAAQHAETDVLQTRAGISDTEKAARELRAARDEAARALAALDTRLAEIAARQDAIHERLADEHGATLDDAGAELDALQAEELFQPDTARAELPRLREQIRGLGAINALALESYEEEQARLTFLQAQRADLAGAEDSLRTTIREINDTARRRFDETFAQIREAFQRLFVDLFGADAAADLALDGDDPLEAPVVISARPSGKRPVSLAQLSGGEKTLTATALLFAIYLVKPSPFCILDEVDAPLDDANVARFMHLIRSFADSTQFILVTHNKLTMEAADRMYGVTMPTPGISRLVGVRFDEAEATAAS